MVDRRSFAKALWLGTAGLIARATTTGQAASPAAPAPTAQPPAPLAAPDGGPANLVPTVATRADVGKATAHEFVRVQSTRIGAPPVDFLYRVQQGGGARTANDIELGPGRWGKMEFPGGTANAWAFGAIGNGAVDDTVALQAFFDYVTRNGVHGVIPAGVFRITQPLRIGTDTTDFLPRGFTIEGAGRTGIPNARTSGGTLIRMDTKGQAVILWKGSAWRDGRISGLGLACRRQDDAAYGLLVESSEVSNLVFENIHVENTTTAFGLLIGSGSNGEFCSWSKIQTQNVLSFFYCNSGQAYGLRFQDVFCYYRPGGTLCRFEMKSIGGGARFINFDASPMATEGAWAPRTPADTTFLDLSDLHNAPITVIGGRFEHITTILRTSAGHANVILNTPIQFIGVDFTTDLTKEIAAGGRGTVELRNAALTNVVFMGCSIKPALWERLDLVVVVQANTDCCGFVRFDQCAHWGYSRPPTASGPFGEFFGVSWEACVANGSPLSDSWKTMGYGRPFDRCLGLSSSVSAGFAMNYLRWSAFTDPADAKVLAAAWISRHGTVTLHAADRRLPLSAGGTELILAGRNGVYQDIALPVSADAPSSTYVQRLYYRAVFSLRQGRGPFRLSLMEAQTGQVFDEVTVLIGSNREETISVSLVAMLTGRLSQIRMALDNLGGDDLGVRMQQQHLADRPDAVFVPTRQSPVLAGDAVVSVTTLTAAEHLVLPVSDEPSQAEGYAGLIAVSSRTGRLVYHDGQRWVGGPRSVVGPRPPTEGKFQPGDECRNSAPAPGKPLAWVCVAEGTPGQWAVASYMANV